MVHRYIKTLFLISIAFISYIGNFAVNLLSPSIQTTVDKNPHIQLILWAVIGICLIASVILFVVEHNSPTEAKDNVKEVAFEGEIAQLNRRAMLNMVRRNWIEGVLHKSLWNQARLVLNLEGRADAVIRTCDLALRRAGHTDIHIEAGTSILEIYKQEEGELLLLGEPGAGKTTLLLEIGEALLQEADSDPTFPIPVVIGLASWTKEHTRLDEWMVEQLNRDYGIPIKIGKQWVEKGSLIPLLDGLDEVEEKYRSFCVEAINLYRQNYQNVLRPMVVSCRVREYESIPNLRLNSAVVIQALTKQQVNDYLKAGGKPLAGLRAILKDEPTLYDELFTTPLMLHVAVVTYEGQSAIALRRSVTPSERRRKLWDAYIERVFERKAEENPLFEKTQALQWLSWLGHYLVTSNHQQYLIEQMQPQALSKSWQQWLVCHLAAVIMGVGTLYVFIFLRGGQLYSSLFLSMLLAVCASKQDIVMYSVRRLNIKHWKVILTRQFFIENVLAVVLAIIVVLFVLFIGLLSLGILSSDTYILSVFTRLYIPFLVILPLILVVFSTIFSEDIIDDTNTPNEAIRQSIITSLIAFLISFIISSLAFLIFRIDEDFTGTLIAFVVVSPIIYGGLAIFNHYLLRAILWSTGEFPANITGFLDWAVQRGLVQRVGGGWRFVHRTLQERFAERFEESNHLK